MRQDIGGNMGQALLLAVLVTTFEVRCQAVEYSHQVDYQHFEGYHDYKEYQPQFASERISTDATSIQSQLATEITKLERETKLEKRYQNFLNYEKIFLRLVASGSLALGRNILFQSTNTVAQGDDDEEDAPDDNESRSRRSKNFFDFFDEMDVLDHQGTSRANFVPQIPGEPLFTVPDGYLLQVIGRALQQAGFAGPTVVGIQSLAVSCGQATLSEVINSPEYSPLFSPASSGVPKGFLQYSLNLTSY